MTMNAARIAVAAAVLVLGTSVLIASGPLGIYGIVEKVVLEPNDTSPDRIQVWGAFAYVDGGASASGLTVSAAKHGYLYFKLPAVPAQQEIVKREWADLKAVAGTGQVVGFGRWGYIGAFSAPAFIYENGPGGGVAADLRVRPESEAPSAPATYQTDAGVGKLTEASHPTLVKQLRDALKR